MAYDVVVIGAGVGGYNAAIRCGQLGLKVLCLERQAILGGTCLNIGCIPSKALLHASELFEAVTKDFPTLGIEVEGGPGLDLAQMQKQKTTSVEALRRGIDFLFKKYHVEHLTGEARFVTAQQLELTAPDGTTSTLETRHVIIASGSRSTAPPGVSVDQQRIVDSEGALALSEVPKRLIVIGAGTIGLELGSVWRRLGAEVEVIEFLDRTLAGADAELAHAVRRSLEKQGMKFRFSAKVARAEVSGAKVTLEVAPVAGGASEVLEADYVLVATGRAPVTEGLQLERIGVRTDPRGFILTEDLATGVPGVWAIGDVTHGPMLAHKAEDEAVACAEKIAGHWAEVNYDQIPSVLYTKPEAAWVGKTEEELKAAGVAYAVGKFPFMANARAKIIHETEGFAKVLVAEEDRRILGVHLFGSGVSEMIAEANLGLEFHADAEDVGRTIHPHPTRSEALRQAAMAADGWAMQA